MPKWIKSEADLPKHGVSVLIEDRAGQYRKMEYNGSVPKDWWLRNINRWLDESEDNTPSFNIGNMRDSFYAGKHAGDMDARFWNTDSVSRSEYDRVILEFSAYLKAEYNIEEE